MTIRSSVKVIHHVKDGPKEMYVVDANSAVARFPDEWSHTPWKKNGEKAVPMIEIPAGWQDLKPSERINLAVKLGAKRVGLTAAKADEMIEAEVEKREHDAAAEAEAEERETRERQEDKTSDRQSRTDQDKQ